MKIIVKHLIIYQIYTNFFPHFNWKKSYPRISFEYIFLLETLDKYVLKKKKKKKSEETIEQINSKLNNNATPKKP